MNNTRFHWVIVALVVSHFLLFIFLYVKKQKKEPVIEPSEVSTIETDTKELHKGKEVLREIPGVQLPQSSDKCIVTGCSNHICASEPMMSTCEWFESYACYKTAICKRQENGECGWTNTQSLVACLAESEKTEEKNIISTDHESIPSTSCQKWFDGCNYCDANNSILTNCTKRHCFDLGDAFCVQ